MREFYDWGDHQVITGENDIVNEGEPKIKKLKKEKVDVRGKGRKRSSLYSLTSGDMIIADRGAAEHVVSIHYEDRLFSWALSYHDEMPILVLEILDDEFVTRVTDTTLILKMMSEIEKRVSNIILENHFLEKRLTCGENN